MEKKSFFLIAIITMMTMCVKAQEVKLLSGKYGIVVRQNGEGTQSYRLKVGGKSHSFTLSDNDEYRVSDLPEKEIKVRLDYRQGNLQKSIKGNVRVYGDNYEATLPATRVEKAYLDHEVDELTVFHNAAAAPDGTPHLGAAITYTPHRGTETTRVLAGSRTTVVTTKNNISVRQAYLPEGCADTLFSESVPVTANDISLEDKWAAFKLPNKVTVEVDDSTRDSEAVVRYAKILLGKAENEDWKPTIKDAGDDNNIMEGDALADFYNRVILRVLNVLYTPEDTVFIVNELTNRIGAMTKEKDGFDGGTPAYLAHKGNNNVLMKLNIPYLENFYRRGGWEALSAEQWGIFLHELCHAYQKYPRRSRGNNDDYAIGVEGIADAVRFTAIGFGDKERLQAGLQGERSEKRWMTPYRISACFLMWLRNYDGDFIRKFEKTIGSMPNWTVEKAVKHILGDEYEVEYLWNKYIQEVKEEAAEKGIKG